MQKLPLEGKESGQQQTMTSTAPFPKVTTISRFFFFFFFQSMFRVYVSVVEDDEHEH